MDWCCGDSHQARSTRLHPLAVKLLKATSTLIKERRARQEAQTTSSTPAAASPRSLFTRQPSTTPPPLTPTPSSPSPLPSTDDAQVTSTITGLAGTLAELATTRAQVALLRKQKEVQEVVDSCLSAPARAVEATKRALGGD